MEYCYYIHPRQPDRTCRRFSSAELKQIENAVFSTIFENFVDVPSFECAIAESMPDEKMVNNLQVKIGTDKLALAKVEKGLNQLVDIAMEGTLAKETLQER
jgi:hypothetical protein